MTYNCCGCVHKFYERDVITLITSRSQIHEHYVINFGFLFRVEQNSRIKVKVTFDNETLNTKY